ncbi:hypothetical protein DTX80_17825 [Bacilli bacterium]|nr:hypothetical protein WH51_11535 [Bacilli bacterium VT-13-104]PZD83154.1 hypothetical protein DEJ64_15910 [Bacilli bacterium]PZD84297.1 hypothetical protein DEJ60_15085 [Bacilli bacterium]PZD86313.1 hypothetical protein DEJ66_15750 [Bacilli bacterium]RCO04309.1 hypothetical protein DTX80_17825 [Bacilli bacterium]
MKKLIIFALTFSLILGACGSKSVSEELIGKWDVTSDNGNAGTMNIKENNTLITKFSVFEDAYNYDIDTENNELSVWKEKNENDVDVYKIEENENGFTLTQTNKEDKDNEILTLTKTSN